MVGFDYQMIGIFQIFCLRAGILAPQNKGDGLVCFIQSREHRIGECLPAAPAMPRRFPLWDGQDTVEQKNSLPCQIRKIARRGKRRAFGDAKVGIHFLKNVSKRGWESHAVGDGEGQPGTCMQLTIILPLT